MRNLADLKAECHSNGISVTRSGKREAKADYEKALAKFYWRRDHGDEPMPPQLHPMLARNLKDLPDDEAEFMWQSPRFVAQLKVDGCRLLMFMGQMGNHFTSRRLSDKTYRYNENTAQVPHLANLTIPDLNGTILDGEVVCPKAMVNTGKTVTLNGLQATVAILALNPKDAVRVQQEQDCELIFKVFDILHYNGQDVTRRSYLLRKKMMEEVVYIILGNFPKAKVEIVPVVDFAKKVYYDEVVRQGFEGIMLKDMDAPYEASSSRTKAMFKVKRFEEIDGFVTGFAAGDVGAGWEKMVGALEVSCFDETSRAVHPAAWVTNMTFEQRCAITACPQCGHSMNVEWENQNGKRVVTKVHCAEHGDQPPTLIKSWYNRVLIVRGQEFTARVFRLKHATIISERNDKPIEECTLNLAAIKAKFEGKAGETGISL